MIEIQVNGIPYSKWETATLTRSIDSSSSVFNMVTSSMAPQDFPVKRGDQVTILIDNTAKIYGFVDQVSASGDASTHSIQVAGRDNTCDLIDSTVPDSAKSIVGPITLKALCETVISGLGAQITVSDESGQTNQFIADDLQAAEPGDKCMDFLQSYSRKTQVFLVPSGGGNLVIFRPGAVNATSPLLHQVGNNQNNVKSWSVVQSQQNMYNTYQIRSQDNIGYNENADYGTDGMSRNGQSTDASIRTSRFIEVIAEESMTDAECLGRSKEEANIRRARSIEYTAVVAGFSQVNGSVWDIGLRVAVKDEIAGINGIFIIRSVEYSVSLGQGEQTRITCAPIDAYKVQAVASDSDKRKSDEGSIYSNPTAPTTQRFKRDV